MKKMQPPDTKRRKADEGDDVVFILDDIRAGFRLHHGGSHQAFNFTPDISCFCKAIANGYPLSAAVGRDEFKQAASKVFMTGSYWFSAMPMAAALTCLHILKRDNVVEHLQAMGKRLTQGLENTAAKYGLQVTCSGPPALPYMSFAEETNFIMIGDLNSDNIINIQDIILLVNLILSQEYNNLADLNQDSIIDVLDIVQLVNIILN